MPLLQNFEPRHEIFMNAYLLVLKHKYVNSFLSCVMSEFQNYLHARLLHISRRIKLIEIIVLNKSRTRSNKHVENPAQRNILIEKHFNSP